MVGEAAKLPKMVWKAQKRPEIVWDAVSARARMRVHACVRACPCVLACGNGLEGPNSFMWCGKL